MARHDSIHDPLRPELPNAAIFPHYEDRVLVKRLPWPEQGDLALKDTRKEGPQLGEVIACGKYALHIFQCGENIYRRRPKDIPKHGPHVPTPHCPDCKEQMRYIGREFMAGEVKPGDKVIYSRVPPQEFTRDGETYTFVFEEQHILAVVE
jgi:co-chaperonin GroES (HSP10)